MRKRKMLRVVISSWAIALAVSVVPAGGVVSGEPVAAPAPIGEQTNPETSGCLDCQEQ
ncbi:MAG: hypothetical protein GFH27_549281n360 [Chloroflexi bacterium AL-W]|nr:hypothetical protein [Chloroflexi bacterium AL-N1]NOK66246.1 hypothetical protein [Chloroflexi bacterium AL-N10]NOK73126.1 hypothetical protein [Chloroflexi bacterium AL-N5]NOK80023.1 hypothetical protein [Chloroflexi bacterium AL-W]NOK88121.1 hypothetical protein [Chloroflexi bacterium AL-N15]